MTALANVDGLRLVSTCTNPDTPGWIERFSALRGLAGSVWRRTLKSARVATIPADTVIFHDGSECRGYLLVLSGTVRVQKTSGDGHKIILYRVRPGESCVLTTSCLLAGERYPAQAVTESEVSAVSIPVGAFRDALAGTPGFREFVFETYTVAASPISSCWCARFPSSASTLAWRGACWRRLRAGR